MFKGTGTRTAGDIARAIDSVGGQLDAFTDKEHVGVYARVMDMHAARAFEILSDIVLNPSFRAVEIRRERNVIFEEINTVEDSPQDLIHDLYLESLWPDHPLGRPISGTKESVARITRKDILAFFRRHYCARNMVLTVAGSLRHREIHSLAERHFGGLAAGTPADGGVPPQMSAARRIRAKANLEQIHICLGTGCPPLSLEDRFGAHLLCTILGGGMSSRLFQNVREKRGLVYSIESTLNLFRDTGTLVVSAAAVPEAAAEVVGLILKELKKLREAPVAAGELRRAKDFLQGSLMLGLEASGSRMAHLAQQHIYFGRIYSLRQILRFLENVRAGDVRRLAGELFRSSALNLTALGSNSGPDLETVPLRV